MAVSIGAADTTLYEHLVRPTISVHSRQVSDARSWSALFAPALPAWVDDVLAGASRLPVVDNWDGRGARATEFSDLIDALGFLDRVYAGRRQAPAPVFIPLASGGVQMQWTGDDLEVEAIFDSRRSERVLLVTAGDHEDEEDIDSAEHLFSTLVDRLSAAGR